MRVRLFSYGGSGLKFLTNFLNKHIDAYDTEHSPHSNPCQKYLEIDRIIYVYSDPRNAVLSFFRRNAQRSGWLNQHLLHLGLKLNVNPDSYAKDFFDHKYNVDLYSGFVKWLLFRHPNIVYVKYEYLRDTINNVLTFLNLDVNLAEEFCNSFCPRSSNYEVEDSKLQQALYDRYKKLIELQSTLDNFYIGRS